MAQRQMVTSVRRKVRFRTRVLPNLAVGGACRYDAVIIDTAGRLNIDSEMMSELRVRLRLDAHCAGSAAKCPLPIHGDPDLSICNSLLMKDIKQAVNPSDVLLVVDAMTGQEAAGLVKSFNDQVIARSLAFLPLLGPGL